MMRQRCKVKVGTSYNRRVTRNGENGFPCSVSARRSLKFEEQAASVRSDALGNRGVNRARKEVAGNFTTNTNLPVPTSRRLERDHRRIHQARPRVRGMIRSARLVPSVSSEKSRVVGIPVQA